MINEEITKALAHEIKAYIKERKEKKQEALYKDKPKKNKQGLITNGAFNERLAKLVEKHSANTDAYTLIMKSKKDKEQSPLDFQKKKYSSLIKLIPEDLIDTDFLDLKNDLLELIQIKEKEYEPSVWLTEYCLKAKDISFATHVGKLTHSSSKSSSILDTTTGKDKRYLTTNSLNKVIIDTASSNASSLPIAGILQIALEGVSVLDCLKNEDLTIFKHITDKSELISMWVDQLKQAYDNSHKKSYFLSKQTYFPIGNGEYHLLLPLKSSSLIQALHLEHKKYWDDEKRELARTQKAAKKFAVTKAVSYPNKAYIHVTGSNHSNASSLNGRRGGRISLLPTMPPSWKSIGASYSKKATIFDKTLSLALSENINELKKYLVFLKEKELSSSEPVRHAVIVSKLTSISDSFFDYIQSINTREGEKGWTIKSQLPDEQQLLLEPRRIDEKALRLKTNKQWQEDLSKVYGRWLKNQLNKDKKLNLKPMDAEIWWSYFSNDLREYIAFQEIKL